MVGCVWAALMKPWLGKTNPPVHVSPVKLYHEPSSLATRCGSTRSSSTCAMMRTHKHTSTHCLWPTTKKNQGRYCRYCWRGKSCTTWNACYAAIPLFYTVHGSSISGRWTNSPKSRKRHRHQQRSLASSLSLQLGWFVLGVSIDVCVNPARRTTSSEVPEPVR